MKVVILDFDGTIADTEQSIIQTIQATMQALHLPVADETIIREMTGVPIKQTLQKVTHIDDEQEIEKAIVVYRKLYNDISLNTVQLFPYVKQTLQSLYLS